MERNVIATSKGSCNSIAAILAIAVILATTALLCYTIRKSSIELYFFKTKHSPVLQNSNIQKETTPKNIR
jgi:hypothetical protein